MESTHVSLRYTSALQDMSVKGSKYGFLHSTPGAVSTGDRLIVRSRLTAESRLRCQSRLGKNTALSNGNNMHFAPWDRMCRVYKANSVNEEFAAQSCNALNLNTLYDRQVAANSNVATLLRYYSSQVIATHETLWYIIQKERRVGVVDKHTSYERLVKFLDMAGKRGLIKPATAASMRSSCSRIFSVLDESEKQDLKGIDIDQVFERFQNLHGTDMTPTTLRVHKSRARSATSEFLRYVENPAGWSRTGGQKANAKQARKKIERVAEPNSNSAEQHDQSGSADGIQTLDVLMHNYPLRPGCVVTISGLPTDLHTAEAARIGAYLMTLCADYKPG